jgi:hypothetical protein
MNSQQQQTGPSHSGAALIGVHELAEFVFCPRAGLLEFENRHQDVGLEDRELVHRLDYLPDFDAQAIEAALEAKWKEIWKFLTWAPLAVVVAVVVGLFINRTLGWLLALSGAFPGYWLWRQIRDVATLAARFRAGTEASGQEPDMSRHEIQPVNWWSLLKAGFSSVEYDGPHEDPALGLIGAPWRVLHRDSLRIPVFRKISGKPELHAQHRVRMAAYAHLVTTAEGGQSPYGVVLFGRGYDGVAVPFLPQGLAEVRECLARLREMLAIVEHQKLSPEVPAESICANCHWGRPIVCGGSESNFASAQYRTKGNDKRIYSSRCGDRYRWVPPHKIALAKGLREPE